MTQRNFNRNYSIKLNPVALRARYRIIEFLKEDNKNNDLYFKKVPLKKKESSFKFLNDNYKLINKLKKKSFQELLNDEISCSEKVHDIIYKVENKYNNSFSRNNSLIQLPKINKLNSSINSNKNEKKTNEENKTDNNHINKTIFNNLFHKKKKIIKKRKHSMDDLTKNKNVKIKGLYGKDINTNFKITQNGGIIFTNSIWRTKNINNLVKYRRGIFFKPQEKKDCP